jgi:hypothetical protein
MMKRLLAIIALAGALAGCALTRPMVFRHPTTGASGECRTDLGDAHTAVCAQTWLASGYVRVQ